MEEYQGFYYELAFHDYLQALCPSTQCVNTNKTLRKFPDGQAYVHEDWGLNCLGEPYPQVLINNVTDDPGAFAAFVPQVKAPFTWLNRFTKGIDFPTFVVDFKPGPKGWSLEYWCVEWKQHVWNVGVAFYARSPSEETYQDILAAAEKSGIGFYIQHGKPGWDFRRVNHDKCPNEPLPPQEQGQVMV